MARFARVVAPGLPHHITQRGNRRQQTFFSDEDYQAYIELMAEWCGKHQVEIWAYCLMPNHIHLIAVPPAQNNLVLAVGEAHRRYTRRINFEKEWRGHLWQGRFASYILDETYLMTCARYIETNPVRAKLVENPKNWYWSSAVAHINKKDDQLVKAEPLNRIVQKPWEEFLSQEVASEKRQALKKHERTGRPLGNLQFIEDLENKLGRALKPGKPGPKPKKQ